LHFSRAQKSVSKVWQGLSTHHYTHNLRKIGIRFDVIEPIKNHAPTGLERGGGIQIDQ
jgi:hypothetical protein